MRDPLRTSLMAALVVPALFSAAPRQEGPRDEPRDDESYQGEAPERYARVRALEGDVRIRKGDSDEDLSRGTPVAEGDIIDSRGRGVLQLGDGTRVAFAGATRFTVAALFKDAKGERQVLLRLDYGRLRVQMGGESAARLRVDTPSGTVTCTDKATFAVETERDRTLRVKVFNGRVGVRNERDEARLSGGERLTVYGGQDRLDRIRDFNTYEEDEFDRWSERSTVVRRGESWSRVPAELRYYADDLDDHGRWVQSDEYGWVWKPGVDDPEWRPYWQGRWAAYPGGMTWVSSEPWGYVTYHHGRWAWGAGLGWYWIPGVYYSPAWVAWRYNDGYCGWAPLNYWNAPCDWGYGAWHGYGCWNVVRVNHITVVNVNTVTYRDRSVITAFHPTGGTTWAGGGGRSLAAPWTRTPLMVRSSDLRNPADVQRAFDRDVARTRFTAYEQAARESTGRTIIRRDLARPVPGPASPGNTGVVPPRRDARVPFEQPVQREAPRGLFKPAPEGRPVDRPVERPAERPAERTPERAPDRGRTLPEGRPVERPAERQPERAPERTPDRGRTLPTERPVERPTERPAERPAERPWDRRPEAPRERPRPEERPRTEERAPRREERPPVREERRADPPPRQEERRSEPPPRREERRGGEGRGRSR